MINRAYHDSFVDGQVMLEREIKMEFFFTRADVIFL